MIWPAVARRIATSSSVLRQNFVVNSVNQAGEIDTKYPSRDLSGEATLKTWVFAILRNKIIDYIRQRDRTVAISSLVEEGEDLEDKLDELFNDRGYWKDSTRPAGWPDPERSMASRQFWPVFEICLDRLPQKTARVFMMREFLGFESSEICDQVGLTTSNCHVILHPARMSLRLCLEAGWGRPGE